ncbi:MULTISPECIES: hypothetical protein [Micromonospora]|uniref:hypothetical protein n=1 Tax=Micromonospora TaxID=1873 RepID=UPI00191C66C9|nr:MULTISPECIES: hypothetical protein [unclassified Micromonospora]MBM0226242.1 hypothetical protein [Micromonospora sp. ATA51]
MNSSDDSASMTVALGRVVAPSRTVVLACGGFLDQWADLGEPLSVRAMRAADTGGAHLQDWLAEAVAVPAGPGALTVSARTRPGTYEAIDTIATLDVDLNLPWSAVSAKAEPVVLGDLPVDPSGMVIGDAVALDSWVGFLPAARTVDGLADLRIWGKGDEEAWAHFGAQPIPAFHANRVHGWLDLPVEVAHERAAAINRWAVAQGHFAHMASVDLHSHHHLGWRAGWQDPLGAGVIEVAGCPVLCVGWAPSELQRFRAGRSFGQVYPLTLEHVASKAVLRWSIPPAATEV